MVIRTYSVPTISCQHCKHAIESEVAKLADVELVEVDIASKTVRIAGAVSDEAIRNAIDEAGYDVEGAVS